MGNRVKAKTNISFLFLSAILVAGTITAITFQSSTLSFMKEVYAALSEHEKDNVKCINKQQ